MNVLPMLFYLHHLPETGQMLRRNASLASYCEQHLARASVKEAVPPPFPGRSSWTIQGAWPCGTLFLVYNRETDFSEASPQDLDMVRAGHWAVLDETKRRGILVAASPLVPTATATTIRKDDGKPLILDGPFAETKEQLAGYYILDCNNLDEAIEWAAQIPTGCKGGEGCIEIRPLAEIPLR
jgi:hypothetical protein